MTPRKPIGPRVDTLEEQVAQLERTTTLLRRDQSATRKLVRELGRRVDAILPGVKEGFEAQTKEINHHVDEQLAAQNEFVSDTMIKVAREWPAAAIIIVTAVLAVVVVVIANWLLAAQHLPHIH